MREEEVVLLVEKIKGSNSKFDMVVDLSEMIIRFINDVICRVILGRKYIGEEGVLDIKEYLGDFFEVLGVFIVGDFIFWLGWVYRVIGM